MTVERLKNQLLFNQLRNGIIDIMFLNIDGKSIPDDIYVEACQEVQDCFVVSEKYTQLLDKEISLEEINNYPLIVQAKGSNTRSFLDNFCLNHNILLNPNIEIASYSLVVEFTKMGLGIGYVTEDYIKDELNNKTLFKVPIKEKIPKRSLGYAISKRYEANFSTKKLIEIIKN